MKRIVVFLALFCLAVTAAHAGDPARTPGQGDFFPDQSLPVPEDAGAREYLGLEQGGDTFAVSDIDAELVLVEIFSMYCPYCQKEAPEVNRLLELIRDRGLGDRVKILGIAPGNSDYEVSVFRSKFSIAFPLFPDPDFVWHKRVGEVGTPYFFLVRNEEGKSRVLYSEVGGFGSAETFLERILEMGSLH
jgi:peroxiredoxin